MLENNEILQLVSLVQDDTLCHFELVEKSFPYCCPLIERVGYSSKARITRVRFNLIRPHKFGAPSHREGLVWFRSLDRLGMTR